MTIKERGFYGKWTEYKYRNLPVSDCAGRVQWRVRRDASEADIFSFAVEALLRGSVSTVTTIFSYNIRKTI